MATESEPARTPEGSDVTCVIIGAGVSGICTGVQIAKQMPGATFAIFDREDGVSGTWHAAGGYPGAFCDVPSHVYSFSFELNPNWTRKFSSAAEIKAYVNGVAAKYGVLPHIRTLTEVVSAVWDAGACRWVVTAKHLPSGSLSTYRAQFVVSGVGALYKPKLPEIAGLETFSGPAFHSARWRHDVDVAGKRVAVIGTGASAIQIVPRVAQTAAHVTVYQRTPAWIVPRNDFVHPAAVMWLFRALPAIMWLYRTIMFFAMELNFFVVFAPLLGCLSHLPPMLARRHLAAQVPDADLRERLTPRYAMGCKRVLLSDDYYPAFSRANVTLVNDSVTEVRPAGLVSAAAGGGGSLREADVLIFATGFDIVGTVSGVSVRGLGGADLTQRMTSGAHTYLGVVVADFPNFFICLGPNTGLGHNSIIFMIEAQVNYALQCMRRVLAAGGEGSGRGEALVVRADAQAAWDARTQARLSTMVWASCHSWYNQEGGRNITLWPGCCVEYWWATLWPRWEHFDVIRAQQSLPAAASAAEEAGTARRRKN